MKDMQRRESHKGIEGSSGTDPSARIHNCLFFKKKRKQKLLLKWINSYNLQQCHPKKKKKNCVDFECGDRSYSQLGSMQCSKSAKSSKKSYNYITRGKYNYHEFQYLSMLT